MSIRDTISDTISTIKKTDLRAVAIEMSIYYSSHGKYILCHCPFHDDKTPSLLVFDNGFKCLSSSCGRNGDILNWYAYKMGLKSVPKSKEFISFVKQVKDQISTVGTSVVTSEQEVNLDLSQEDLFKMASVYHSWLLDNTVRHKWFKNRGFTAKTIEFYRFGWEGQRYVVPIWDGIPGKSHVTTLRFRGSEIWAGERYTGIKNYNDPVLFNQWVIKRNPPTLLVVYGELDAALGTQFRLPTVSGTNGNQSFRSDWINGFKGDVIFVPDKGEEEQASKDAKRLGSRGWVGHIPLETGKDLTDYFVDGNTVGTLLKAMPVQVDLL